MKNKEFLFIYDAAMCNPNGDPDQENKPRMDRKTQTNLVSDGRLKRYIRDYLEEDGNDIFVSMDEGRKTSVEKKLHKTIKSVSNDKDKFDALVLRHAKLKTAFQNFDGFVNGDNGYQEFYKSKLPEETDKDANKKWKGLGSINNELLVALAKENLIDIRFFGGAFAVAGFSNTFIGSIQINWGYSLHPVELIDSNSIVTIMSGNTEGESNIGKKEGLYYSLIAFTGTINSKRAEELNMSDKDDVEKELTALLDNHPKKVEILNFRDKGLSDPESKDSNNLEIIIGDDPNKDKIIQLLHYESDVCKFRRSIIQSIYNARTDSKKNQYPRLYMEIEYNDDACYGRLGDLRNLIEVTSNKRCQDKHEFEGVRSLNNIDVNFSELISGIGKIKESINKIRIWKSLDSTFSNFPTDLKGISVETLNI